MEQGYSRECVRDIESLAELDQGAYNVLVLNYGKGRVSQTLLGHSAKTYEAWEAGEMLRRATAWVAGKEVHENKSKP